MCLEPKGRMSFTTQIRCLWSPQKADHAIKISQSLFARLDTRDSKMDQATLTVIHFYSIFAEKACLLHMLILLIQKKEDTIPLFVNPHSQLLVRLPSSFSFLLVLSFALMVMVLTFQIKSFLMDTFTILLFQEPTKHFI